MPSYKKMYIDEREERQSYERKIERLLEQLRESQNKGYLIEAKLDSKREVINVLREEIQYLRDTLRMVTVESDQLKTLAQHMVDEQERRFQ